MSGKLGAKPVFFKKIRGKMIDLIKSSPTFFITFKSAIYILVPTRNSTSLSFEM